MLIYISLSWNYLANLHYQKKQKLCFYHPAVFWLFLIFPESSLISPVKSFYFRLSILGKVHIDVILCWYWLLKVKVKGNDPPSLFTSGWITFKIKVFQHFLYLYLFFQFDIDDLLVKIEIFEMSSGPLNVDFGLYCY